MGRKNLLDGLMGEGASAPALTAVNSPPRATRGSGAVGAVGASIAALRASAVLELDPGLIDAGGLEDRLEDDAASDAALRASIAAHGQQVPVLVRPHETAEGRYRIVYGRRRVLAARDLGVQVRALVRGLEDREAILAQGQENTQRRDLSFIEKAHFARQMRDLGYDRAAISDAINADKTVLSRMLSVVDRVPLEAIAAIGAAPSVGRDRWLALADLWTARGWDPEMAASIAGMGGQGGSDARFEALYEALAGAAKTAKARETRPGPELLPGTDGRPLGTASRSARTVTLNLRTAATTGFADWLIEQMPELHRRWLDGNGDQS